MPRSTLITGGALVSLCTLLVTAVPVLGLAASVAVVLGLRQMGRRRAAALVTRRQAALPELMDALVALIHSGLTPQLAWRELPCCCPPVLHEPIAAVTARLDRGDAFADALGRLTQEVGAPAAVLVDALVTAERYGLPLAPLLDRLAGEAAARRRRDTEARSRQLPVRLSFPLVFCTLPSFVLLAIVPVLVTALSSLPRP